MKGMKIAFAAVLGAASLAASAAFAQDPLPVGMAHSKNLVERTVTIDDQVFRVNASTEILNRLGARIRLEHVLTEADLGDRVDVDRVTYAYDAHGDTLALLRAIEAPR